MSKKTIEKKYYRKLEDVIEDDLLKTIDPSLRLNLDDKKTNKRIEAVKEVLCRIPLHIYESLKTIPFYWFIPDQKLDGLNLKVTVSGNGLSTLKIIYLNPLLERCGQKRVMVTVAHELAHFIAAKSERDITNLIEEMGFEYPLDLYLTHMVHVIETEEGRVKDQR